MLAHSQIEVMSPVGSWESLQAAIQGGANAIYFGIEQLNMRARSSNNFTIEDLKTIGSRCKEHNIKTYLTLNTIVYNHDVALMKTIILAAKESNIDSVIAMDHAAIQYANSIKMPVHISTQLNITNFETVKFYSTFADVMVLSRELTLMQIEQICDQITKEDVRGPAGELVKIEIFVHGALCMAVSGKCYLSLGSHNSSANRGACKQNCRRKYTVTDEEGNAFEIDNEYIMSPQDLCTIGFMDKVIKAGVSVLKIEGRSKGPDYVKETAQCYREARDAVLNDTFSPEKVEGWMDRLSKVYNRGFWGGYYLGKKMGEWTDSAGSKAKRRKKYIGDGVKYFGKIGIGEFKLLQGQLSKGDAIMITGPTTGIQEMVVESIRVENSDVETVGKGVNFSMPVGFKIRNSDKLFIVTEEG